MAYTTSPGSPQYEPQREDIVQPISNENWGYNRDDVEGEPDISDLYTSDTTPLTTESTIKRKGSR